MPANDFKRVEDEFNKDFIKSFNGESDKEYSLEADSHCPQNLHNLQNDWYFLPKRMKIEKVEKLMKWKTKYIRHIGNLKQALKHGLVLKKVCRIIKFKQKSWLRPYTGMNANLRKKVKNDFEKDWTNYAVFGKTTE